MEDRRRLDKGEDTPYDYSVCPVKDVNEIRILELRAGSSERIECLLLPRTLDLHAEKPDEAVEKNIKQDDHGETTLHETDASNIFLPSASSSVPTTLIRQNSEDPFAYRPSFLADGTNAEPRLEEKPPSPTDGIPLESGYEALSYVWGLDEATIPIYIGESHWSYKLMVRPNLYAALKRLRLPERNRLLWIDAICINQSNINERNHQVSQMAAIYRKANQVCIWLGDDCKESAIAFAFSRRLDSLRDLDSLFTSATTVPKWKALLEVMKLSWFNRRWVVQEIALAKRATVFCEENEIDWDTFANAVALFNDEEYRNRTISTTIQKTTAGFAPDELGDIKFLGASRLVEITENLFRESSDGRKYDSRLTLEALVSSLSVCQASRPHDTIYALLPLAKNVIPVPPLIKRELDQRSEAKLSPAPLEEESEGARKIKEKIAKQMTANFRLRRFHIDYNKAFFFVCLEFLERTIGSDSLLDIICRPWVPKEVPLTEYPYRKRPSWLVTTEEAPYGARPDGGFTRVNADSLVGITGLGRKNYSASGEYKATRGWRFGRKKAEIGAFFVEGFVVDEVAIVCESAIEGTILGKWLELGGWSEETRRTALPPSSLWRTLVGNRGHDGLNPPPFYQRACSEALRQAAIGGHINTTSIIYKSESSAVRNFLRRTQEVTWGRKMIKTKYGHLGLARNSVEPGDLVCILYGCSVPVILRKATFHQVENKQQARSNREAYPTGESAPVEYQTSNPPGSRRVYVFLGEAYIHEIMDGEAFAKARQRSEKKGEIMRETFEIR